MNLKNILTLSIFGTFLLYACKTDTKSEENTEKPTEENESFIAIQELFEVSTFENSDQLNLLKELEICTLDSAKLVDPRMSYCTAANFKFFPLQKSISEKNGFILLIKAGTGGFPLRRLLIFQRERGELVKVNGFVANLIGRIPSDTGYDDLLLRFNSKDGNEIMFYNCLFVWDGSRYQYKQVEVIEGANWGGNVKAHLKDSISKEIYQDIMNKEMIF